ncbi:hypothetical protein TNCT_447921 [Trichonephila clavata]|uniref:Uncharacterized protein n=1 Tax=Trichonephila clavata TaxID=2740835 RepID=A0A8X6LPA2_TRICU|nr:hypothetical protein TNCT_447921 [Trichonephila clavata]
MYDKWSRAGATHFPSPGTARADVIAPSVCDPNGCDSIAQNSRGASRFTVTALTENNDDKSLETDEMCCLAQRRFLRSAGDVCLLRALLDSPRM